MQTLENTPLQRAQVRCKQLEDELKKSPDFQLYLITKATTERVRMERLLLEIPEFKLWHLLSRSIRKPQVNARQANAPQSATSVCSCGVNSLG